MTDYIFFYKKTPHFFRSGEGLIDIILEFLLVRNLDI
ncbi:hypothetical protein C8P65_10513 [Capnocytophaga leadbetteri]|uniref:Uncharacterized protein n=1 Tax=Capnocytophaga leadbetteri TaxID=327575 RepID=A0A2T5XUN9_9FLAO|nr:hypothetical protein C8P65_10513 [Capnocytophaga leadbetteri]